MDYSTILIFVFGLAFTVVPSILMSALVGYSQNVLLVFLAIFSSIAIFFGILPTWFFGITVLIISALLYDVLANRGNSA